MFWPKKGPKQLLTSFLISTHPLKKAAWFSCAASHWGRKQVPLWTVSDDYSSGRRRSAGTLFCSDGLVSEVLRSRSRSWRWVVLFHPREANCCVAGGQQWVLKCDRGGLSEQWQMEWSVLASHLRGGKIFHETWRKPVALMSIGNKQSKQTK